MRRGQEIGLEGMVCLVIVKTLHDVAISPLGSTEIFWFTEDFLLGRCIVYADRRIENDAVLV